MNERPRSLAARFEPVPGAVVVDKYRVERVLGEGGMGVVVLATHIALDQRVAIKFLLPEAMRNKEAVERFQREAKVAAKINSEHVARVHDVGMMNGGQPFIVMEYLEGSDLREVIQAAPLAIDDACEIALQACEALAQVHAAGIVHRDLKPSNLFVVRRADGSPCVKLLDFGISKFSWDGEGGRDPALTATAAIMGSPTYMSPEQLKSTKEVDSRTDVWSLGAVLYEAVTGRPAFRGETVPQVCAMIAADDPALPSSHRPELPIALDRAILGCLDKNPNRRARLVDLARALADVAPPRARASLERVEAVLGEPTSKPREPASRPAASSHEVSALPVLSLATSTRESTHGSRAWGATRKGGRGGRGVTFFALGSLAAFGFAAWTGRLDMHGLERRLGAEDNGASGPGVSAISAHPSSPSGPSNAPTAAAAELPLPAPDADVAVTAPAVEPPAAGPADSAVEAPSADEESDEVDDSQDTAAPAAAAPSTASDAGVPARALALPHPAATLSTRRHRSKPKPGASKVHRHH